MLRLFLLLLCCSLVYAIPPDTCTNQELSMEILPSQFYMGFDGWLIDEQIRTPVEVISTDPDVTTIPDVPYTMYRIGEEGTNRFAITFEPGFSMRTVNPYLQFNSTVKITISAWVNIHAGSDKDTAVVLTDYHWMGVVAETKKFQCFGSDVSIDYTPYYNKWTLVVCIWDGSSQGTWRASVNLGVDKEPLATFTTRWNSTFVQKISSPIVNNPRISQMYIGGGNTTAWNTGYSMYDLVIFGRIMSIGRLQALTQNRFDSDTTCRGGGARFIEQNLCTQCSTGQCDFQGPRANCYKLEGVFMRWLEFFLWATVIGVISLSVGIAITFIPEAIRKWKEKRASATYSSQT